MIRRCIASNERGEPCRQPPLLAGEHCFWHDPEHQQEAAEARRLGGMRRRREGTIVGAFEVGELDSVDDLRRLLQIAVVDTLGLENSIARSRTLAYLAQVGAVLLEKGDMEQRLASLEGSIGPRLSLPKTKSCSTYR